MAIPASRTRLEISWLGVGPNGVKGISLSTKDFLFVFLQLKLFVVFIVEFHDGKRRSGNTPEILERFRSFEI